MFEGLSKRLGDVFDKLRGRGALSEADVDAALRKAEELGGTRRMGPERSPGTELVVGHFTDPEGNLIGVAGGA